MPHGLFAEPRSIDDPNECLFYHTVDLPNFGTIPGFWDIRGREAEYLGNVELRNRRVLEIGPASGHLSFYMERSGAEVVSVEAAPENEWEFFWDFYHPLPKDLADVVELNRGNQERIKNSYWLCHRALGSEAKVHYGSAYSIPPELGEFDLSVLACILLHNKNPLRIIENCARVTREEIVIVEPNRGRSFAQKSAEFLPADGRRWWDTWWGFSPKFFSDVLRSMGFPYSRVTFHTQEQFGEPEEMFTIVARRQAPEGEGTEGSLNLSINSPVERLRIQPRKVTSIPVTVANTGAVPIDSYGRPAVRLSYHWKRASGEVAVWDGIRTLLPRTIYPADAEDVLVTVRAPEEPGDYLLEITALEEDVIWYDGKIEGLPLQIEAAVTS